METPRRDPLTELAESRANAFSQRSETSGIKAAASEQAHTNLPVPEPPGDLVQVGGHRMHLYCTGQADRTVLLEAGLGDWSLHLRPLQEELARTTRVCAYDREGYGWSEPGPASRTGMQIIEELEALLQAADEPGPYILVGHSFGGLTMLMFAEAHPDDVAGVVLIDSSHPRQQEAFAQVPAMDAEQAADQAEIEALATRAEAGLIEDTEALPLAPDFLPPELKHQWAAMATRTPSVRTSLLELDAWSQTTAHVGGPGSLGGTPLIVLAAGIGIARPKHPSSPSTGRMPSESTPSGGTSKKTT